ncbi:MAG TPA: hypothetical protein VN879_06040 [Candidatus Acidoferrales bacterium]|nr:hypothetical protein [Candidatus Acidoferrales bacterium]
MWKSIEDLDVETRSLPNLPGLNTLYALSRFWKGCVFSGDYRATEEWCSALKFSTAGQETFAELSSVLTGIGTADVTLAFFMKFFHHDLFFDYQESDSTKIREILGRELLQERVRLPHRFGRSLYDRFNDTYLDTRTDHLMSEDVLRLLQGTSIGVYQLGRLISGPLGIIESKALRYVPPIFELPLWHCSDTGCKALHDVRFVHPNIPVVEASSRIGKALDDRLGPEAEWSGTLTSQLRMEVPRFYVDLPALLADCIIGEELAVLLERALVSDQGALLRGVLALPPRRKREADGPAKDVASRQSPEAQLQLLLVLPDKDLVGLIDDAVISRAIRIPLGETREVKYNVPMHSGDSDSQLSALGIRSVRWDPVVNLTRAIWRAYQLLGLPSELEWHVRSNEAKSPYEALVAFIRNRGPAESIRELVLSSARITTAVCDDLHIPLTYASGSNGQKVDHLLWKLGFNPMQFDDSISRFKARLSEFNEVILTCTPITTEDARERVRAAGVNVFVSLEDFLDRLVSYNVWLLSSDHFLVTEFRYSSADARRSVARTLGAPLPSGDVGISWDILGGNPLGTLLRYLRATADWIQGLPGTDRKAAERPEKDLPHFADNEYLKFPFRHSSLWADSNLTELQWHSEFFARIVKLIEEAEPASLRNGLDHFREADQFPSADKLLACVARLGQALELADVQRFLPKVYWRFGRTGDRFGATVNEFRDYAGRLVLTYGPALVSGLDAVSYKTAYVLAPGNLLGSPNASLVFQLQESSEFSAYWEDYPRRRRIQAANGKQVPVQDNPASCGGASPLSSQAGSSIPTPG